MAFRLFNTLTQRIEEFTPLEGRNVRMYTCGPTVYHYVHIGNFRTFVFQDILRRYLLYKGYKLHHVMNITDVEDKIITAAAEQGVDIGQYTKTYTEAFLEDMEALRIQQPDLMPRATDHIPEMVELIQRLSSQGLTYEREGSIYFRINQFPGYGRLSRIDPEEFAAGGRQDSDEYSKENPRDFVLWKAPKEGEASWDSDLGPGRPGWHLECSTMSMKYLGESFDIHCGGVDLVFPHHENEIAQSEGATGNLFVKYWIHGAHLVVEGEKMSKSSGNFYTLRDLLEKGYSPLAIRYLLASVRYRTQLNFTFEGLGQAASALARANNFLQKVREVPADRLGEDRVGEQIREAREGFESGLDSDLNTAEALGSLFTLIRQANPLLEAGSVGAGQKDEILELFRDANRVFEVFEVEGNRVEDETVQALIDEREEARRRRDYTRSDEIRDELAEQGIVLEDTGEGTRWKRAK